MRRKQTETEIVNNVVSKLSWHMATRSEPRVAKAIYQGKEIAGIYGLEETGLLDGFYEYLEKLGVIKLLGEISPLGVMRVMVPFVQFVLLYFLKTLFGVESINSLPRLLFSNEGAMRLIGFNAHQVEHGVCRRGEYCRKKSKQGPICDDALTRNIVKIPLRLIEQVFNRVVRILARAGVFPKRIKVIIDPTDIPTTWRWQGCGCVTRRERVVDKTGAIKEIEVTVYGFKLMVVFYAPKKLPLAAKLVRIEEHGSKYLRELILQADENLGKYSNIIEVMMDREYLAGAELWWLNKQGYLFVVPARSDMAVTQDARSLALRVLKDGCGGYIEERVEKVKRGYGKQEYIEEIRTKVVGIKGLMSYDQYGPSGWSKDRYKKDFVGKKINAVVIVVWKGKEVEPSKWVVYLTNKSVRKPLVIFDDYDERSIIENCLMKESKQGWFIKHAPQKSFRALAVHSLFTLVLFALVNAYRDYQREQEEALEDDVVMGIRRWREEKRSKVRNKAIVFVGERYGIFWLAEIMVLSGVRVKDIPKAAGTREEIFLRYKLKPR